MLEAWVDLEDLKDSDPAAIPGFIDRMTGCLSVLGAGEGSSPDREALVERIRSGASLAEIFVSLAGVLQALGGPAVGPGRARTTPKEGIYRTAVAYEYEEFGRACLDAALPIVLAAVHDRTFDAAG
ncbi:MAG: cyanophycin synthetase, partial [Singulisphaera sp.]|nr:cyanophycin synthetase [Singulisphaera sp.]